MSAKEHGVPEEQFAILQQIARSIAANDDIRITADLMLNLCLNYTRAEKGSLMLLNEEEELTIFSAQGIESHLIKMYKAKIGEGIAGSVAEQRMAVLVEDIDKDERFNGKRRNRYSTRSFISCPIVSKNKLLGVLNISDKSDGSHFTEDEFTFIRIISNQAAIALDNALLMQQLRAKAVELESMNRRLIESDVLKTEFLVRISHELRTPLNAINGSIYYLQRSEKISKSDRKDFQDVIATETDNLIRIVENLLDFLRLDDESKVMKTSIISLNTVLQSVSRLRSLNIFLEKRNIRLSISIPKDIAHFVGDQSKVSQLFINLVEGLACYLEKDDSIDIFAHQDDFIQVFLTCSREIPESLIASLFRPRDLFLSERSEEGLKLYLARKAIESHKWNMWSGNTDKGFSICISIPKSTRQKMDAVVNTTMDMFIDFISEMLGVNICSIMLSDNFTGELTIKSARGLNDDIINRTRIKIGNSIAGWVALEGRPLFIEDIEKDQRFKRKNITQYDTKSLISIPIMIHDKVLGVINLNNKKSKSPFTNQDFFTASVLSDRVSYFLERLYHGDFSEDELRKFMTSFDKLLSAARKYHKKGSNYAAMTCKILEELQAPEEEIKLAVYISMIYDLGLSSLDEDVLKRKQLTTAEKKSVMGHPKTTVNLLSEVEFSDTVKHIILHHHERYDGSGYPDGLKGQEIPFLSRVLHVVDTFCAMTKDRPYREAMSPKEALEEMKRHVQSMYDPVVVDALEAVLDSV